MSSIFNNNTSSADRRSIRAEKEEIARKKQKRKIIIVISIVAVIFVCSLFLNSSYVRRSFAAVTVEGMEFSAVQFDYFHTLVVDEYFATIQAEHDEFGASLLLPNRDMPFSGQFNHMRQMYWNEYFFNLTVERMGEITLINLAADAYGFVLPDEVQEEIELILEDLTWTAMWSGMNLTQFIRAVYSPALNEELFIELLEFTLRAEFFKEHIMESFVYSQEELEAFYNDRRDEFDMIIFRRFIVMPEELQLLDFDSGEEYLEAREEAEEEAYLRAQEIAAGINSFEDFMERAREEDYELYNDDLATYHEVMAQFLLPIFFRAQTDWLLDESRTYGNVQTFRLPTSGTAIIYFVERDDNSDYMREMRQILFSRNEFLEQADIEIEFDDTIVIDEYFDFEAMRMERADEIAARHGEAVLEMFTEGGSTLELLLELMEEHSHDTTPGGLYTMIARADTGKGEFRVVQEISSWLFEPNRQIGDYELIRTENFGYHLIYLYGFSELRYRDFIADTLMRERDIEIWIESLGTAYVERQWAFFFTQR